MTDKEFLKHYGILGMKWGFRKGKRTGGKIAKESTDYKKAKSLKGKSLSEMTNDELRTLNNRMQLERQYKDLSKSSKNKGSKIVSDILVNTAKQSAQTLISKYVNKQVERYIG